VIPGQPAKCPYCGFAFQEREQRKFKPLHVVAGELVEAGIAPGEANHAAAFIAAAQHMDARQRQKAMWNRAFAYASDGPEGKRRLDILREALGYKAKWTDIAWNFVQKKRRAS